MYFPHLPKTLHIIDESTRWFVSPEKYEFKLYPELDHQEFLKAAEILNTATLNWAKFEITLKQDTAFVPFIMGCSLSNFGTKEFFDALEECSYTNDPIDDPDTYMFPSQSQIRFTEELNLLRRVVDCKVLESMVGRGWFMILSSVPHYRERLKLNTKSDEASFQDSLIYSLVTLHPYFWSLPYFAGLELFRKFWIKSSRD